MRSEAQGDGGGPHVLVIEDDPEVREAVRARLSRDGFRVTPASDGQEGLYSAISGQFDVIVLDLGLPGMGGEEVLRALRPLELRARVVVLSAQSGARWQAAVRDLGAVEALQKPVSLGRLSEILTRLTSDRPRAGAQGAEDGGGSRFWSGVVRFVFTGGKVTGERKGIGLGILLGLGFLALWTLFGRRI